MNYKLCELLVMVAHSCEQVLCLIASWVIYNCQICRKPSTNHNSTSYSLSCSAGVQQMMATLTGAREKLLHQLSF